MKNKFTKVLLILSLVMLLVFVSCACGDKGDDSNTDTDTATTTDSNTATDTSTEGGSSDTDSSDTNVPSQDCKHENTEKLEKVAPTCTKTGKEIGSKCADCGTILVPQKTIAALGHTAETIPAAPATCSATGLTEGSKCSVCGDILKAQEEVALLPHTLTTVEAQAPTCSAAGWDAYETCSVCGYTTKGDEIPAIDHTPEVVPAVNATCLAAGLTEGSKCSACGETLKAQEPVSALAHTPVDLAAVAPTCTETGLEAGSKCSVCETILVEQKVIDALGHTFKDIAAIAPTCTVSGSTAGKQCTVCEFYEIKPTEIKAEGHKLDTHDGQAPTCTEDGWESYQTCSVEGCGYVSPQKTLEKLGHNIKTFEAKDPTCKFPGNNAYERCLRCDYTTREDIPKLGHTMVKGEAQAPTCTEIGWKEYEYCSVCGYEEKEEINKLGHDTINVDAQAPTCEDAGWEAYEYCSRCDYTTKVEIDATGHTLVDVEAQAPTCTEIGWEAHKACSACDYTEGYVELEATGHTLVDVEAQAPACTEIGWEAHKACSVCDYTEGYVELEATGHTLEDVAAQAPTCTEPGWNDHKACSAEGCDYTEGYEKIEATGHITWILDESKLTEKEVDGEPVLVPTCKTEGQYEYYCEACGKTEINVNGETPEEIRHAGYTKGEYLTAPTCTEAATYECSECGEIFSAYVDVDEDAKALGHTLEDVAAQEPTCTEIGWNAYQVCSVCGHKEGYEELEALGHTLEDVEAQEPTCTEIGWNAYKACSVCGHKEGYEELEALGHSLVDVEAQEPTCTEFGWNAYKACSAEGCDYTEGYEELVALGHTYTREGESFSVEYVETLAPTCITAGREIAKCTECGTQDDAYGRDVAPTDAHVYDIELGTTAPTCTEKGYTTFGCSADENCVLTENRVFVDELGHTYTREGENFSVEYVETLAPTCITKGFKTAKCTECDATDDAYGEDIPATGAHVFNVNLGTTAPTCTEGGYTTYGCSVDENCVETENRDPDDMLGHDWILDESLLTDDAPTCKTEGNWPYICNRQDCDATSINEKGETPLEIRHAGYEKGEYYTAPTCITDATYECTDCGEIFSAYVDEDEAAKAHGIHKLNVNKDKTEPTCTEKGYTTYGCSLDENCVETENRDFVDELGHTYTREGEDFSVEYVETLAPTCITKGFETAKCTECDATDDEFGRDIDPTGAHVYDIELSTTAPTCTEIGYTTFGCSADENCVLTENRDEVDALGHTYARTENPSVEYVETLAPTCITEGFKTAKCTECDATDDAYGEYIPATGAHVFNVNLGTTAPTCTEKGYTTYGCSADENCDKTENSDFVDELGHTYTREGEAYSVEYVETLAPTCITKGRETAKCTECDTTDDAYGRDVDPTYVHVYDIELSTTAPTCLETGYTTYGCSADENCVLTYYGDFKDALGHTYERDGATFAYEVTTEPTCITPGEKWVVCEDCEYCTINDVVQSAELYRVVLDPTGEHKYNEVIEEVAPSCTTYGYKYSKCTDDVNCTETIVENWADKLDHNFGPIDPETGKISCVDCGVEFINITGLDDVVENTCLTGEECDGVDCDHIKVVVTGKKEPEADTELTGGEAFTIASTNDKRISIIALNGAEDTAYTIELLDAEGNAIETFEVTVGEHTNTFDLPLNIAGNAYIDISEVADQVATINVTASAAGSTVAFYNAVVSK